MNCSKQVPFIREERITQSKTYLRYKCPNCDFLHNLEFVENLIYAKILEEDFPESHEAFFQKIVIKNTKIELGFIFASLLFKEYGEYLIDIKSTQQKPSLVFASNVSGIHKYTQEIYNLSIKKYKEEKNE